MQETAPAIDPRRSALLVMDYQIGIVGRLPDVESLLERASQAISTARSAGVPVGYVRVAFGDDDYAAVPPTNKAFSQLAAQRPMDIDAPHAAVHPKVAPRPEDIQVRKVRIGAFSTTDLHERLRAEGIDTLILAGVSTSGVVLSTVRDAGDKDYRLYVLEDCCADPDPEIQDVLMHKVFPRQAYVIATAELPNLLRGE